MSNNEICNNICRARRVDNGEWVKGYFVFDEDYLIVENLRTIVRGVAEHTNVHSVCRETIGRSTGKNDKNDVPIFEGDILSWLSDWKYIVRYGKFGGQVGLGYYYGLGFYIERIGDPTFRIPFNTEECDSYEVVGNIHDNKELLEVEEN